MGYGYKEVLINLKDQVRKAIQTAFPSDSVIVTDKQIAHAEQLPYLAQAIAASARHDQIIGSLDETKLAIQLEREKLSDVIDGLGDDPNADPAKAAVNAYSDELLALQNQVEQLTAQANDAAGKAVDDLKAAETQWNETREKTIQTIKTTLESAGITVDNDVANNMFQSGALTEDVIKALKDAGFDVPAKLEAAQPTVTTQLEVQTLMVAHRSAQTGTSNPADRNAKVQKAMKQVSKVLSKADFKAQSAVHEQKGEILKSEQVNLQSHAQKLSTRIESAQTTFTSSLDSAQSRMYQQAAEKRVAQLAEKGVDAPKIVRSGGEE